jgi:hypothetical protein
MTHSISILAGNPRRIVAWVLFVGLALLISCAPVLSIHPLYTGKDIVFEPQLVGTWFDAEATTDRFVFVIEKLGNDAYKVAMTDPANQPTVTYTFEVHLVKLGDHLFLDAIQSDIQGTGQDLSAFAVSGHMISRISLDGDVLSLKFLGVEWVAKGLKAGSISIRHEDQDDGTPVLTAGTTELQKFALDHVSDDDAFSGYDVVLHRKK